MNLLGLTIVGMTLGIALLAKDVPTREYMLSTFQAGQSFYSEGAYDQAIEKFEDISSVRSLLLDDSDIVVVVGKVETAVKDAAIYQMGNAYFKMFEEEFRASKDESNKREQEQRQKKAEEYLEQAVSYFSRVEENARSENLRALAQNRITTCWYSAQHFREVIRAGQKFIAKYPDNAYVVEALYNIGWSYYELKEYVNSIAAFTELTERFKSGFQVNRAFFQIGECYYDQGQYRKAIPYYQQLVDQLNIGSLSEQEIQKMQFEKVAGLVDETEYELTAKAQIRIGDCYSQSAEFEKAERSYRSVITVFAQERRLVEKAYQSLADMYFENRLFARCVDTYREAIVQIPNNTFKARMQFQLAQRYTEASEEWGEDYFDDAIREYNVYVKAYGEIASRAGYSLGNSWFEIGRAYYAKAEKLAQQKDTAGAREAYAAAVQAYDAVLAQYPDPNFVTATRFNIALSKQRIGEQAAKREAEQIYRQIIADNRDGTYARSSQFQLARMFYNQELYDRAAAFYDEIIAVTDDSTQLDVAHFELGLALNKKGEGERATKVFLQVRETAPQSSLASIEAGRIYLGMEQFDRALEILGRGMASVGSEEERAQYHYLMGKAWVGKEEYARAVDQFTQAINSTDNPKLKEIAQYDRGTSYSRLERYAEAAEDLRVLVDSANERIKSPAQKMLGLAYLRLNRQEEALASYRRLATAAEDSVEQAEYLVLMLTLYLELEQYDTAIATGRKILAMDLADSKGDRDYWLKEQVYYLIGESQQRKGQYEEVISTYSEGLKRYPNSYYSVDMAYALGTLYFQSEKFDKAAEVLSAFVARFPNSANIVYAYYYLGYAYFNLREFAQSAEIFEQLVEKYPHADIAAEALMRASESAFNLEKFDEAIALYQRLLEDYLDSPFSDDALYNTAWAFYELKDEEKFIRTFERLLATFPNSEFAVDARFTLGDYYFNKEDYQRALVEYQHVLADYPEADVAREVPEILKNIRELIAYEEYERTMAIFGEAVALDKEGEEEQARQKFAEVVPLFIALTEKYPGTEVEIGALSNLGTCYEFLRQWKKAVQTYDKVIALFEDDKASEDAYRFAKGHRDWIVNSRL